MLLAILLLLNLMYFDEKITDKNKFIFSIIILTTLTLFTKGFGTDYLSYEYIYTKFAPGAYILNKNLEPAYQVLMFPFKIYSVDYHTFSSFISISILLITSIWIYNSSTDSLLSIIIYYGLFFIVWSQSAYRQGIVLALGSFLFFNRKYEPSFLYIAFVSLLLMAFHISAMIYLIIAILLNYKWGKKTHLIILLLALVSTFIPFDKLLFPIANLSFFNKVLHYLSGNNGFFDFPSIVRIIFFLVVWLIYDNFTNDKYSKKIADAYLLGISLYFLFKFSEITASRITIYTFILIIILAPDILSIYTRKLKIPTILQYILILIVSLAFLSKEVNAYKTQVGYRGKAGVYSVDTIFSFSYSNYDRYFAEANRAPIEAEIKKQEYINATEFRSVEPYKEDLNYFTIRDHRTKKVGVLNSNGNWLIEPTMDDFPIVFGDIMVRNQKENILTNHTYVDLTNRKRSQEEMRDAVSILQSKGYNNAEVKETRLEIGFFDVIDNPNEIVNFPERISTTFVVHVEQENVNYNILYFKYYHYYYYLYLDDNFELFSNDIAIKPAKFNQNNILKVETHSGSVFYNSKGELIWYE